MKKILILLLIIIFVLNKKTLGSEIGNLDIINEQLEVYNFNEVDGIINKSVSSNNFSIENLVKSILVGEFEVSISNIFDYTLNLLFNEMFVHIDILRSIILIGICSAFIKVLTDSFKSKGAGQLSFYIMYVTIVGFLIGAFNLTYNMVEEILITINNFILSIIPIIVGSLFLSGNPSSALLSQPILISLSYILINIMNNYLLPFIYLILVADIFNNLSNKQIMKGFIDSSKKIINFTIKGVAFIFISVISIFHTSQNISDNLIKKIFQSSVNVIPVIGNTLSSAVDTVYYFSGAIKSSLIIAFIIGIVLISFFHIIKILAINLVYGYVAILIEPICEKKIYNAFKSLQTYIGFLLSVVGATLFMFVISIIILLSS